MTEAATPEPNETLPSGGSQADTLVVNYFGTLGYTDLIGYCARRSASGLTIMQWQLRQLT